ncbi:MAG: ABC transporter ATP-binding protein [Candidatus Kryptonium sp.]
MIELKDVYVQVNGFSLKGISLVVYPGTCHIIIGPTGCGKTVLLEAMLGLRQIKKGLIIVDGKDVTNLPTHQRGFSYVPQDLAIFPHLTVEENITYGIRYGNISEKSKYYKFAKELSELLGIAHLLKRKAINLSGGEKQRVAFARALASGSKYLLLDEPLSALHEAMKKELWFLLKELQKRYGFTILMVSHDLEESFFLADYISVMIDGVIHQTDKKEVVYRYPQNLEVAKYFGIKNIFKAEVVNVVGEHYRLYCEELKAEFLLPVDAVLRAFKSSDLVMSKSLNFGIRSEDVMILRRDLPIRNDNLLKGIVHSIYPMGSNSLALFKPERSERLIEIIMPEYAFIKLNLKPFMSVTVSLRSDRLFVLK